MSVTTSTDRFVFDRTRQAAPQIVDYLREKILSLELAPGSPLSRADLQKQMGLSQTPVRDALLKLEEEGLVTVYPQYATLVSRVNLAQARQAHFMRRAIEADIARYLAEHRTNALVTELRKANIRVRLDAEAGDYAAFLIADRDFHHVMYQHADMLSVWAVVRTYSGHLDRLRRMNLKNVGVDRILCQHEALIDVIDRGDAAAAEAALREHLSHTLSTLETVAADYPEFIER